MQASQRGEVRVLGPLEVVGDDGPVSLARKERQLLAALVVAVGKARPSDELVDALWGESPPASAPKLLQVYVSKLRKALPASVGIATRGSGYALEAEDGVVDAIRFERLLEEGRQAANAGNAALAASLLRRALSLWRGPAYGELAYEEMARAEAERLEELRLVCDEERLEATLELGRQAEVLPQLLTLANANPLRERLQGLAMVALYRAGRQTEALERYATTRSLLFDELGLEPGRELRELERRILQHDPGLLSTVAEEQARFGLPTPPNALLGRARELGELDELIRQEDVRLLVLTGAGGSGKTRLALEAARRSAASFANGAAFVGLAAVRGPGLLLAAISSRLGIEQVGDEPLETLAAALHQREMLVVLDNLEHLREATPVLVELVSRAPRLTLLCTSRVVLHLSGERVYPVAPLATGAASELFVTRAREADAGLRMDDADEETIRRICERLDGLPLAIELAATRVRSLSPRELLARLDVRLPVLTGGPHDLPARQRTLRATIEWSFELLEPRERDLLTELAVFVGGFTLEAVEDVCEAGLDELAALVDANLVYRVGDRYLVLETIREFAAECLESSGNRVVFGRRHALYFRNFASSLGLYPEAVEARLESRHDLALAEEANLRAALEWSHTNDPQLGLEIAIALEQHWVSHNLVEGRQHLELLLAAQRRELPRETRARALRCLSGVCSLLGDTLRTRALVEESLALYTELGDEWEIIHLRHRLAICALELGDPSQARALWEENLGRARARGFRYLEAEALGGLGWVTEHEGDLEAAWKLTREHVEVVEELQWRWGEVLGRIYFAELSLSRGRLDTCEAQARAALGLARQLDDRLNMVRALAVLAARAGAADEAERAGQLWGAIEAEEAKGPIGRGERHRNHAKRALAGSGDKLSRWLDAGRKMSLVEAAQYALAE